MIKQALEYLIGLGKTEVIEIDGQKYSTNGLDHIKNPRPADIDITTLTGLVDYIKSGIDKHASEKLLVHVLSPKAVKVYSALKNDANRDCYIECSALTPAIHFDRFIDSENFNIMMQSCFAANYDSTVILKVVGNIKEENVRQTGDDGVSQVVTAKVGIAKVADVMVPNPVVLRPFRTFAEVEQPESKFIFRMKDGPACALFEADGGAWKNEAMQNIKRYLETELEGCNVSIIA